ncbi:MAG: iron-siderophore ABC transporter substrate-binding protein, partial [Actinomycetota bacterium]
VIALDLSLVDPALILGLEVVGYTTFNDPEGPLPDLYGAAVDEYASEAMWVGDLLAPNLELVAAAQPDLILTSAVRHQAIRDELTAIAPTVMTDSAGAGWKESLRLVAAAVGQTPDAEAAIADYEARAAALGTRINETHDDPTLSVVRFVDVIRLYQPNSFSGVVLTDVGLARPDSQQLTDDFISVISEEELAQADADFLVYAVFDDPAVTSTVDQLVDSPLWTDLDAVAAGRAFPVADDRWMSGVGLFGAEAILEDLAEIFELES